jgi:hypothetical protein
MGTLLFGLCGQFLFYRRLEYTHMYLKITNLIGFCCIREIVFIESNKKHYHLNLKAPIVPKMAQISLS